MNFLVLGSYRLCHTNPPQATTEREEAYFSETLAGLLIVGINMTQS